MWTGQIPHDRTSVELFLLWKFFMGGTSKISKLNINYQKKDVIIESKLSHINLTIPHLTSIARAITP